MLKCQRTRPPWSHTVQAQIKHLTTADLEAGLDEIRNAPKDQVILDMIVRRPEDEARGVIEIGELDTVAGLVGDNWQSRPSSRSADGKAHPDMQINIMNSRVTALVAQNKDRWQLAGDPLFVDFDLSKDNVPPGTKLVIGSAVLEATDQPHTGCQKFSGRFGVDALKLISSPTGKELQLRGICAKVVQGGQIRTGDTVRKL